MGTIWVVYVYGYLYSLFLFSFQKSVKRVMGLWVYSLLCSPMIVALVPMYHSSGDEELELRSLE